MATNYYDEFPAKFIEDVEAVVKAQSTNPDAQRDLRKLQGSFGKVSVGIDDVV